MYIVVSYNATEREKYFLGIYIQMIKSVLSHSLFCSLILKCQLKQIFLSFSSSRCSTQRHWHHKRRAALLLVAFCCCCVFCRINVAIWISFLTFTNSRLEWSLDWIDGWNIAYSQLALVIQLLLLEKNWNRYWVPEHYMKKLLRNS